MTISTEHIKILKSEVMTDANDGGGQATAIEVVDGESNNLFPDIPEASRVYGKIEIRKVYPAVVTEDTDTLFGAQFLFTKVPEDEKVNVCAFTTRSWTDRRVDAKNRLETYLAEGTRAPWELMEKQLVGQRAILLMGTPTTSPPIAGQSLVLIQNEGEPNAKTQYVRIVSVITEYREFFKDTGGSGETFKLAVSTCEITDPLIHEFTGFTPQDFARGATTTTKDRARVRETRVADANNYYSAKKLSRAATKGEATIHVDSVYTNIVPSAQSESPMSDLNVAGQYLGVVKGSESVSYTTFLSVGVGYGTTALGAGVFPDTLTVTLANGTVIKDNGVNQIMIGDTQVGTIQYDTGVITWLVSAFSHNGNVTIAYENAMSASQSDHSDFDTVTEVNRGLIWNKTLHPAPTKGSLKVTYVNSGKHYTLIDNGDGSLGGVSSGVGVGSVNYETGTVTSTLNAYPDIGSYILYQWGDKVMEITDALEQDDKCYVLLDIADFEEVFSGVYALDSNPTITWQGPKRDAYGVVTGVVTKQAVIDRSTYEITGDASGKISNEEVRIYPNDMVALGTKFTLNFRGTKKGVKQSASCPVVDMGQSFTVSLAGYTGEINPWSLDITVPINMSDTEYGFVRKYDNGAVLTRISALQLFVSSVRSNSDGKVFNVSVRQNGHIPEQHVGTYNSTTRIMTIAPQIGFKLYHLEVQQNEWAMYTSSNGGSSVYSYKVWVTRQRTLVTYSGLAPTVSAVFTDKPDTPVADSTPVDLLGYGVTVRAAQGYNLNPAGISFRLQGATFRLNMNNQCVRVNPNGDIDVVGSVSGDVTTKLEVSLTNLEVVNGASPVITWLSVASVVKDAPKNKFAFYTPLAPIRNGSFQLVVRLAGKTPILVQPNPDGIFESNGVWGWVDFETGFVVLAFQTRYNSITYEDAKEILEKIPFLGKIEDYSDIVAVAGNPGVYNMTVPDFVYVSEIAYNAIGLTYLPLSADLLGLDPVRLPGDGRVPCFRKGDMVVLTDHKEVEVETPVAGLVVPVGETRLSSIEVVDATNKTVTGVIYNLTSGVVSFAQDFSMLGYEAPFKIKATVQDLVLLSDVQVSGVLALNKVLSHNYGVGCLVSSVIYIQDMQARAYNKFHQASWNNVWSDERQGTGISATYNTVFYPVQVTNANAIKERWVILFTSSTTFRCIGEFVGELETGSTSEDYKPKNPNTGKPYFTLLKEGWGGGWVNGYVMRFNTDSATFPVYVVRTILQGESTDTKQGFTMQLRGDIDNEEE